ncbi:hypothetical protein [Marinicella meishanensis]|uniref:hypothetical protein n=1 Tax=Marinicella meishanensis TaxID=2873263 RepID=UPI001CBF7244|nr:hypothetical protein [Marinicella sp. NBU2979]
MNNTTVQSPAIHNALAIAKAQGVLFIREFLRQQKSQGVQVNLGPNKSASLANLQTALLEGTIALTALEQWIHEVEGWGQQHVYLFELPVEFMRQVNADPQTALHQLVTDSPHQAVLQATDQFSFPEAMELQQIKVQQGSLEVIWRQQASNTLRVRAQDLPLQEIDGDWYEFRAFRITPSRQVMRFLLTPDTGTAALYIQLPLGKAHRLAHSAAVACVQAILQLPDLPVKDLAAPIKALDRLDLAAGSNPLNLHAHSTKFSTNGGTIEFTANQHISGFKQIESMRLVRRSLNEADFTGDTGHFNIHLDQSGRTIQMSVSARHHKCYFKAQMSGFEMRRIITYLSQL